jgi:hypothetical protein
MTAKVWANRQCQSRRLRTGVAVRDVTGVLLGRVSIAAARMAVQAGKASWRGRGRGRYLLLAQAAGGANRWMIHPSTAFDGIGRLFTAELRRHSHADSWRGVYGAADAH